MGKEWKLDPSITILPMAHNYCMRLWMWPIGHIPTRQVVVG